MPRVSTKIHATVRAIAARLQHLETATAENLCNHPLELLPVHCTKRTCAFALPDLSFPFDGVMPLRERYDHPDYEQEWHNHLTTLCKDPVELSYYHGAHRCRVAKYRHRLL